ncbi:MAG TPA: hypothetical protein VLT33_02155 [Labilithrix sp.]|nr:hypothetical protein [Labilithrix sp.]
MFGLLGIPVGIAVTYLALRWALRSHRRERQPWLDLLSSGAQEGVAGDGGELTPLDAPFSRRKCLAFHVELVTRQHFAGGVTWTRVFQDAVGRVFLTGPAGDPRGAIDLSGARVILPTPLDSYNKLSVGEAETIFHGTLQSAPPHIAWFVQQLPRDVQQALFGAQRIFFNERIITPGQSVVVAEGSPSYFALGTLASERSRVSKLPIAGELFGAVLVGGLVGGVAAALAASFLP